MTAAPLVLASASPRRQEILGWAGLDFEVCPSDAEPDWAPGQSPEAHVVASAAAKAQAVAPGFPGRLVIGADTVVVLGHEVLGKPRDAADAARMLTALSGRTHTVFTGIAVARGGSAEVLAQDVDASRVTFRKLSVAAIADYVATGDPLDKAGAYGVQSAGGTLVAEVMGSYLNVVGLPLARLQTLLAGLGDGTWETA